MSERVNACPKHANNAEDGQKERAKVKLDLCALLNVWPIDLRLKERAGNQKMPGSSHVKP